MKDKKNQGWIKELGTKKKDEVRKPFKYSKPVNKVDNPNNMAINSRSRAYKSVSPDKNTSFVIEQKQAKANKGNSNGK